jgi:hypothetical protein
MKHFWPNFFIVGAARSGTTSLHEYLNRIDGIYMSSPIKEPNFFIEEVGPLYRHVPHFKEDEKYLSLFQPRKEDVILGESSVSYLYDSKAPGRIHAKVPDARIVIILRDPIDRAYSHFLHHLRYGFDTTFDFLEAIKEDYYKKGKRGWGFTRLYIELGMYSCQVQRYFDLFGRNRVKVIIYEDEFKPRTKEVVQDTVYFLGLRSTVHDEVIQKVFNSSSEPISGAFAVPRLRAIPLMSKVARNIRGNNSFLMALTSPITSAISKNFMFKNREKPALTEKAFRFLQNIYRDDVQELCKVIQKTPSWAARYCNC